MEAYKNVDSWAKPEKPPLAINWMFMRPVMYKEPKGVVLIISPFNFPLWLCVSPMVRLYPLSKICIFDPIDASRLVPSPQATLLC